MQYHFTKMQGCGNDYIYFDCFRQEIPDPGSLSIKLSDRHFGVGGDGIVLIGPSDAADAKMRMFNADGGEGKMCGNAIRCVGKYLYEQGIAKKKTLHIETLSGIKTLELFPKGEIVRSVLVDMGRPETNPAAVPVLLPGARVVGREVTIGGEPWKITCVSMGNPHCVVFLDEIDSLNLEEIGPLFENASLFPERVNTEFVQVIDETHLKMRVWERGSGETLACGTGACAAAVASILNGYAIGDCEISVQLLGGALSIRVTEDTVYMSGPAETVFTGTVEG